MSEPTAIAEYLSVFARVLRVGPLQRRRILDEVEDHLREAARSEQAAGAPAIEAERRAIERFGSPARIAEAFRELEEARKPGFGFAFLWISVSAASVGALLASLGTQPAAPAVVAESFAEPIPTAAASLDRSLAEPAAARPSLAPSPRHARRTHKHAPLPAERQLGALAADVPASELGQTASELEAAPPALASEEPAAPAPSASPPPPAPPAPAERHSLAAPPAPIGSFAMVPSNYPPAARWMAAEGDVFLILHVDAQGEVAEAKVTKRIGYGLDETAQDIARQLRFRPARDASGHPTHSYVNWRVHFSRPAAGLPPARTLIPRGAPEMEHPRFSRRT